MGKNEQFKRERESCSSWLSSDYTELSKVVDNILFNSISNEDLLRESIAKIGLERINIQEGIMVKALLDNGATELVMS